MVKVSVRFQVCVKARTGHYSQPYGVLGVSLGKVGLEPIGVRSTGLQKMEAVPFEPREVSSYLNTVGLLRVL